MNDEELKILLKSFSGKLSIGRIQPAPSMCLFQSQNARVKNRKKRKRALYIFKGAKPRIKDNAGPSAIVLCAVTRVRNEKAYQKPWGRTIKRAFFIVVGALWHYHYYYYHSGIHGYIRATN